MGFWRILPMLTLIALTTFGKVSNAGAQELYGALTAEQKKQVLETRWGFTQICDIIKNHPIDVVIPDDRTWNREIAEQIIRYATQQIFVKNLSQVQQIYEYNQMSEKDAINIIKSFDDENPFNNSFSSVHPTVVWGSDENPLPAITISMDPLFRLDSDDLSILLEWIAKHKNSQYVIYFKKVLVNGDWYNHYCISRQDGSYIVEEKSRTPGNSDDEWKAIAWNNTTSNSDGSTDTTYKKVEFKN